MSKHPRPLVSTLILMNSILSCGIVGAVSFAWSSTGTIDQFTFVVIVVFLVVTLACSLVKYYYNSLLRERAALAVQFIALIFILPHLRNVQLLEILLVTTVVLEIAIYEKLPQSAILLSGYTALVILFQLAASKIMGQTPPAENIITLLLIEGIIGSIMVSMIYYREQLVYEQHELLKIQDSMKQLTKVNLEYQDSAIVIEEAATELERNRITRDIHDIVGYTLTNTIMMMEAAIDMMQRNPLGVASLINTTRENAQEGLDETRRALYKLRENRPRAPKGAAAVNRMIKLFSSATKVKVNVLWDNLNRNYGEQRNFIIFHCIQQGLINAFIHGKADEILIQAVIRENELVLSVADNGIGTQGRPIKEGIGLKGLRERLEKINGRYTAEDRITGFLLTSYIPLQQDYGQDAKEGEEKFERTL